MFQVKEKKYETVGTTSKILASTMQIMAASSVSLQPFRRGSIFSNFGQRDNEASEAEDTLHLPGSSSPNGKEHRRHSHDGALFRHFRRSSDVNEKETGAIKSNGSPKLASTNANNSDLEALKAKAKVAKAKVTMTLSNEVNNKTEAVQPQVANNHHPPPPASAPIPAPAPSSTPAPAPVQQQTTVLLRPDNYKIGNNSNSSNHITYSIDSKPKHMLTGSQL